MESRDRSACFRGKGVWKVCISCGGYGKGDSLSYVQLSSRKQKICRPVGSTSPVDYHLTVPC